MRPQEEIEEFFESELLPEIERRQASLVQARPRREAKSVELWQKLGIVALGVGLDVLQGHFEFTFLAIGAALFADRFLASGLFGGSARSRGPSRQNALRDARQEVLSRLLRFLDPGLEFNGEGKVPEYVLQDSALWSIPYNHYAGEDRIYGKLGGTLFDLSEVGLFQRYGDGKVKQLFRGLLFVADFNKEFRSRTIVLPDATEKHLGLVSRALQSVAGGGRGELVRLENLEFERHFRVYSTDPTEARYLLSPSLMRRIREFRDNLNAEMRLSFVDGRVYVMLEHERNLLASGGIETLDVEVLRRWLGEVLFATSLVEELDLNTRIWTKGASERTFHEARADSVEPAAAEPDGPRPLGMPSK